MVRLPGAEGGRARTVAKVAAPRHPGRKAGWPQCLSDRFLAHVNRLPPDGARCLNPKRAHEAALRSGKVNKGKPTSFI